MTDLQKIQQEERDRLVPKELQREATEEEISIQRQGYAESCANPGPRQAVPLDSFLDEEQLSQLERDFDNPREPLFSSRIFAARAAKEVRELRWCGDQTLKLLAYLIAEKGMPITEEVAELRNRLAKVLPSEPLEGDSSDAIEDVLEDLRQFRDDLRTGDLSKYRFTSLPIAEAELRAYCEERGEDFDALVDAAAPMAANPLPTTRDPDVDPNVPTNQDRTGDSPNPREPEGDPRSP